MPLPTLTALRDAPRRPAPGHRAFGRGAQPPGTLGGPARPGPDGQGDPAEPRASDTDVGQDGNAAALKTGTEQRTPGKPRRLPRIPTAPTAGTSMPDDRLRGWIVTLIVTGLAALTRFVMLGTPTDSGTPIFDEKHYAPQAWQMIRGGWIEDNPGYELVVHPPLAKQLISLGERLFGYDGLGWRFASAVAGTIVVLLLIRIARRMTGSTMLGGAAGILATADGVLTVGSRTALLDIFLTVFAVGAFACLLCDRQQVLDRYALAAAEGRIHARALGPRMGFRWWRFGAGVLLGLGCACKWDGLYYVAFFGVLSVASDVAARRRFGVRRPWLGTLTRDTPAALASLVAVPLLVYLGSWWAWLASEVGVDRHAVGWKVGTGGAFSFIPDALRSLWYYSAHVLEFHEHLTNSNGFRHPWESKPWTWPMGLRPLLYYYADGPDVTGCGQDKCVSAMMIVGTPAMWWLALPVAAWAVWRIISRRDYRYAWVVTGYCAGFLPWFLNLDRQMYYFYAVGLAPFLILGITLVLGEILGAPRPQPPPAGTVGEAGQATVPAGARPGTGGAHRARRGHRFRSANRVRLLLADRRTLGLIVVSAYLAVVIANYVWLWPILTGGTVSEARWQMEMWLPSWR